jgi:hypothetical protein
VTFTFTGTSYISEKFAHPCLMWKPVYLSVCDPVPATKPSGTFSGEKMGVEFLHENLSSQREIL